MQNAREEACPISYKTNKIFKTKHIFPKNSYCQLTNKPCFLQYRTYFLMNNNCLNEPNVWCIYSQLVNSELSTVGQRMKLPEYTSFLSDTLYGCREQKFQSFSIQGARPETVTLKFQIWEHREHFVSITGACSRH